MSPARYLGRVEVSESDAHHDVALPYGLTAAGLVGAMRELHAYLHAINTASVEYGYGRLEDFMQPAGFSSLVSNVIRHVARWPRSALVHAVHVSTYGWIRPVQSSRKLCTKLYTTARLLL